MIPVALVSIYIECGDAYGQLVARLVGQIYVPMQLDIQKAKAIVHFHIGEAGVAAQVRLQPAPLCSDPGWQSNPPTRTAGSDPSPAWRTAGRAPPPPPVGPRRLTPLGRSLPEAVHHDRPV